MSASLSLAKYVRFTVELMWLYYANISDWSILVKLTKIIVNEIKLKLNNYKSNKTINEGKD